MFDYLDGDCDGKLTYQDFVSIGEAIKNGEDISTISTLNTTKNSFADPYV